MLYALPVFLPLIGALVAGLFGRLIGDRGAQFVTCGLMIVAAILSTVILFTVPYTDGVKVDLLRWIDVGTMQVNWTLRVDPLTAVMMFVVTSVSTLVHVYSVGYMSHDPSIPRFMSYLSLFTFAMLMLVTADNFIQLYFGWEGVGLASYLLIGFWFAKPSACNAAMKAFIVNRVGDFGLALGIAGVYLVFDSVQFDVVFDRAAEVAGSSLLVFGAEFDALTVLAFLLFLGAMGKSAQILLHTWLPDAMEGPTPVSALIHAATMVTAGVFLVARLSPILEYAPAALAFITFIGATTAIFAASVGLTQFDIKRVIAYSTCSQLGYMFFAAGVGAYSAAIFHLFTHAFFKALLFLGAGSVIHAMSDEQDMRNMGGIYNKIPYTYAMMWIGSLALVGIFPFAGFYSKDLIIEVAYVGQNSFALYAFVLGLAAAFMTAFYSGRLIFLTFHGTPRADKETMAHVHESPLSMTVPLALLAVGAVIAGYVGYTAGMTGDEGEFWHGSIFTAESNHVLHEAHEVSLVIKLLPLLIGLAGLAASYYVYVMKPGTGPRVAQAAGPVNTFLQNKWYFDELYNFLFVGPAKWVGKKLWREGDGRVIDGVGPNGVAAAVVQATTQLVRVQTGYLYHYAFAMLIGVAALVTWFMLFAG